jgi:hypothetical protein
MKRLVPVVTYFHGLKYIFAHQITYQNNINPYKLQYIDNMHIILYSD